MDSIKLFSKISNVKFTPVQKMNTSKYVFAPIKDTFELSSTSKKTATNFCENIKNQITEIYNKYFNKINKGKEFVEGSNIEKYEDVELFSKDLVQKVKSSGDIFSIKDLYQMQEMHDLGTYSLDDIVRFKGAEEKLTTLGAKVNFKKEAELTTSLDEYVENISGFVKKDPYAKEVSTRNIDKYIDIKGKPVDRKILYRGIIDEEEITHILSKINSPDVNNHFYSPNRITSTTKIMDEAKSASKRRCVIRIAVPEAGTDKAPKSIDINKYYDAKGKKNDFAFQQEVLLPSNCKLKLLGAKERNGVVIVNAKLV